MRVFLDANILFSAADEGSATRRLLETLLERAEAVTNAHALEEARRNLLLKRAQHVQGLAGLQRKLHITQAFDPGIRANVPEEDQPIVAGAAASGCTHLWTSDRRHFARYYGKSLHGVVVVSSIMLADLLEGAG